MKGKNVFKYALIAVSLGVVTTSCSDDEDGGSPELPQPSEMSFIVVSGDPVTDLTGGVYMKLYSDLSTNKENQTVYGDASALRSADSFTQETYNPTTGVFTGYIYARAAASEENGGIGSSKAGLRSYKIVNGALTQIGSPVYLDNFGNTGVFGTYSYAAQISNPVIKVIDSNGSATDVTIDPTRYAIEGVNPSVGNIIDMGNNQVAMVLNYSNRDSAVVAFADYSLNISKVVYTGEIGTSVGAQRSVRYTQSGADDEGNVYVFSGSSAQDSRVGALRIKKGTTEFDPDYKFDILSAADGYRFRKVYHISGDKFLIEFFTSKTDYANMSESGRMAVVDMSDKSLTWVTGLPDPSTVSISWGDGYNGTYYLPVAAATSFGGGSGSGGGGGRPTGVQAKADAAAVTPTIYKIDAATGVATPFMTFASTDLLKAIKILKK